MPEHGRRWETLQPRAPLRLAGVTLLPVERTLVRACVGAGGGWCVAAEKAPYALVIRDDAGLRAVGADGAPIPLRRLRESLAGLDALLAAA